MDTVRDYRCTLDMTSFAGFYALWISVHFLGLATAWMVRMYAGHRLEGFMALIFLASLPMIALATLVGQHFCLTAWPLSACTLAVMIVMATLDVGTDDSVLTANDPIN